MPGEARYGERVSQPNAPAQPVDVPDDAATSAPAVTSHHVAKGVGTTLLSRLGAVIEIVSQPLYVWLFGLASFGLYAVLWAAINLIENIFDLGMTSAMQRTVPQSANEREAADALRAAMLLGVGPCLLVAIIISIWPTLLTGWIQTAQADHHLLEPAVRLFIWALPLWAFVEIATSALRARHLFGPEIRLRLVWEQIIRLVLALLFYVAGFGLIGLFMAHMLSLAITAVLSLRLVARHFRLGLLLSGPVATPVFRATVKAGLSILPANLVARLFGDAPAVILNAMIPGAAGASMAGLFVIARKISSLVQLLRTAFGYVLAPLASTASTGEADDVRKLYAFSTRLLLSLALPLGLVLAVATPAILRVFGPEAAGAATAVALLIVGRVVDAFTGAATPIQQVTRGYLSQLVGSFAGVIVSGGIVLAIMPQAGLSGIALAVSAGLSVASIIPMIQLWAWGGLHPFEPPFLRVLGVVIMCAAAGGVAARLAYPLPVAVQLPLQLAILLASTWASIRLGLPTADRLALGKTGRALRLV